MTTIWELGKLAKEEGIKYYISLNKNELSLKLRLEPSPPNEKFEKYCR